MARIHVFADEAGTFDFRRGDNISRYLIVCTATMHSCQASNDILELKRELAWEQAPLGDYFHATTDTQAVRDRVFAVIQRHDFQIQATIMEKAKAAPKIRPTHARFYQHGWYQHFSWGMTTIIRACDEMHITAASVGTKKGQIVFTDAVKDVIKQTVKGVKSRTSFWQCSTDPCLQLVDYCTWAIQRKWERGDTRSYDLIKDRITYEYDLFRKGTTLYY
jgi:hypothetical protein